MGLFQTAQQAIGVEVGSGGVRLLQFAREVGAGGTGGLALQAAARADFDESLTGAARLGSALRRAVESGSFLGRNVVLALPGELVQSKSVRLPQMPDADLEQALVWEAKDRFGFDVSDGRMAWFRAGEVRRGTEVKDELLLFAVRGETLAEALAAAAGAGLTVAAIDLSPCAAYRACRRVAPGDAAILDIGEKSSQFLLSRNDELVFYKQIEIGGRTIDEAVAQKLGISRAEASTLRQRVDAGANPAEGEQESAALGQALHDAVRTPLEELGRELDMCMRYFAVTFRGSRPDTIQLVGQQADMGRVGAILSAALGVRAEAAQPLRGVSNLRDVARPDRSADWAVAAGLSLYPVNGSGRKEAAA